MNIPIFHCYSIGLASMPAIKDWYFLSITEQLEFNFFFFFWRIIKMIIQISNVKHSITYTKLDT